MSCSKAKMLYLHSNHRLRLRMASLY